MHRDIYWDIKLENVTTKVLLVLYIVAIVAIVAIVICRSVFVFVWNSKYEKDGIAQSDTGTPLLFVVL